MISSEPAPQTMRAGSRPCTSPIAARSALPIGSGTPSGSSAHVPWPAHPAEPSASAAWPFGHSPDARSRARAVLGERPGAAAAMSAAIPVMWGAAMLVPLEYL